MPSKQKDLFGNDFHVEQVKCQIAFQSGNPAALHQILKVCELAKLPLPDWANIALKELVLAHFDVAQSGQVGGAIGCLSRPTTKFKKKAATAISIEIYKGVKKWQANPSRIDELPTSAIRCWYQKKIDPLYDRSDKAEVVLDFRPVCSLVKMDQGFTSGCQSHCFCFAGIGLIRGQ